MKNELLPVGSLVQIRFSKEKYLIIGYYVKDRDSSNNYEYAAVTYPLGLLSINEVAGFDSNVIKKIIHRGLETTDSRKFLNDLKQEVDALKEQNKNITSEDIQKISEQ